MCCGMMVVAVHTALEFLQAAVRNGIVTAHVTCVRRHTWDTPCCEASSYESELCYECV